MLTINFKRDLNIDFNNLEDTLISIISESFPLSKEIYLIVFSDGNSLKIVGRETGVNEEEVKEKYISSGYAQLYGTDASKFGHINYTNVNYVAHTHPIIIDPKSQSRPSGKDVLEGVNGDYEISRSSIPVPHYIVSPKYIYCINYQKDEQTVTGNNGSDQLVSFYGRWGWGEDFFKITKSYSTLYISDQHFSEEDDPQTGQGKVIIEDDFNLEKFSDIKGEIIIDESGTIELITK